MTPAAILYDPDCGFCKMCVALLLRWDRHGRLRPLALGSEEADSLLDSVPEEEWMASWHLVTVDGQIHSAGRAFPELFRLLPGGTPLARLSARFPRAADRGYRWVAEHRSLLGRPLPEAVRRWADRVISIGEIDRRSSPFFTDS
jgi:predicted DCC family thiol-disulfide oxidoreductase YuxK